jgi:hypothetical protein
MAHMREVSQGMPDDDDAYDDIDKGAPTSIEMV